MALGWSLCRKRGLARTSQATVESIVGREARFPLHDSLACHSGNNIDNNSNDNDKLQEGAYGRWISTANPVGILGSSSRRGVFEEEEEQQSGGEPGLVGR